MSFIIDPSSKLSFLQQRLNYAYRHFKKPLDISENVPIWPEAKLFTTLLQHDTRNFFQHYLSSQGSELLIENLREIESKKYGIKIDNSNVVISNGALHGLSLILQEEKPSRVLCQKPVFRSIPKLMESMGYIINYFDLQDDPEQIEKIISLEKYNFIYLNIPNNPTGELCKLDTFYTILKTAEKYNVKILLDMVYDSYINDESYLKDLFKNISLKNIYIINSLSKAYGAPGLRIGWIISDAKNIKKLQYVLELNCICVSSSSQFLAINFLNNGNKNLCELIEKNKKYIKNYFKNQDLVYLNNPSSGTCFLATLSITEIEDFVDFMLLEYKVILSSSSNYAGLNKQFLRIPMGYSIETLSEAFEKILDGVTKWVKIQPKRVAYG